MPRGRPAFIRRSIPELRGRQKRRPAVARRPIALAHDLPLPAGRGTDIWHSTCLRTGRGSLNAIAVILRRDRSLRRGRIHPAGAFDANNGYSVGGAIRVGRALEELGFFCLRRGS
jgi:hypothetical protein